MSIKSIDNFDDNSRWHRIQVGETGINDAGKDSWTTPNGKGSTDAPFPPVRPAWMQITGSGYGGLEVLLQLSGSVWLGSDDLCEDHIKRSIDSVFYGVTLIENDQIFSKFEYNKLELLFSILRHFFQYNILYGGNMYGWKNSSREEIKSHGRQHVIVSFGQFFIRVFSLS